MNTSDTCALSRYHQIAVLDQEHNVTLVQHSVSRSVYVQKQLSVYNIDVYRRLLDYPVKGTPAILELAENDGILTVVEEYISGSTLRSILDDGNRFETAEAARLAVKLCLILQELHNANPPIIHRDIKPSNIIIASDDTIHLLDMNAAKFSTAGKTEDTSMLGTFGYAAPEQFGFGVSGVQTDLYSVGVLLCEMITGHLPKEGLPAGEIAGVIQKCTRIDPRDRYATVEELLSALHPFLRDPETDWNEKESGVPFKPDGIHEADSLAPASSGADRQPGTPEEANAVLSQNPPRRSNDPQGSEFPQKHASSLRTDGSQRPNGSQKADSSQRPNGSQRPDSFRNPNGSQRTDSSRNPNGSQRTDNFRRPNAIPGFRTGNPANMIIAVPGYAALFYISLTIKTSTPSSVVFLWFERIVTLLCGLFVVFFTCNYRNLWEAFHINRIRSSLLKVPAILLVDVLVVFLCVLAASFAASIAGL